MTKQDWKEIIYKNGKINATQVFKELSDYSFLMEQASTVYCHFTNLSKTNYYAHTIIGLIEDSTYPKDAVQDDIRDILKNCPTKKELIEELKTYFDLAYKKEG
jgi:hypothetical protein